MADQQFLASFGVDIDESGVSRLQKILSENRTLAESRLNLYSGDWWENPAWGNEILRMLQEGRMTRADAQAMSTYLTAYVREKPGVQDVTDIRFSTEKAVTGCFLCGRNKIPTLSVISSRSPVFSGDRRQGRFEIAKELTSE